MLNRILPAQLDNDYRGHRLALWLLYPITLLNLAIALGGIFNPDGGAQSADGIPLDTYGPAAARAVIGVAAYLGLANLFLGVFYVLALVRYRAMIPLMYLLLVVDFFAHKGIGLLKPIARDGTATGGVITLTLFAASLIGLVLSLSGPGYRVRPGGR